VVAALDALGELHLLRRSEERDPSDVLEEELQGVGRDLRVRLDLGLRHVVRSDDGDPRLLQRSVELVDLRRLELELVEGKGDLVRVETAGAVAALKKPLRLVRREDILDRSPSGRAL